MGLFCRIYKFLKRNISAQIDHLKSGCLHHNFNEVLSDIVGVSFHNADDCFLFTLRVLFREIRL